MCRSNEDNNFGGDHKLGIQQTEVEDVYNARYFGPQCNVSRRASESAWKEGAF